MSGGNSHTSAIVYQSGVAEDIDKSIASTKDAEVKAAIAGSVAQEMPLQRGKIVPDEGETGSHPKRVEILWDRDDASFCGQPSFLRGRPTRAQGRVLNGDAQTGTVDDSRVIPLSLAGHVVVAFVRFSFVHALSDLRLIHATASMAQVKTTVRVSPITCSCTR